jgi:hypothetical protein
MSSPTRQKGELAEGAILAGLLKLGLTVMLPFGGGAPYDLVVDLDGALIRIQCKTAQLISGHRRGSYRGLVDVIAAYAPTNGKIYWFRPEEAGLTSISLRLTPTRNKQIGGVHQASDYELENRIGRRNQEVVGSIPASGSEVRGAT